MVELYTLVIRVITEFSYFDFVVTVVKVAILIPLEIFCLFSNYWAHTSHLFCALSDSICNTK